MSKRSALSFTVLLLVLGCNPTPKPRSNPNRGPNRPHNPKVAGSNPAPVTNLE